MESIAGASVETTLPPKPTFFILGAAKSGTTTLYDILRAHPQVCFSDPKEPRFFELEYSRGLQHYLHTHYAGWSGEPALGEGRVYNLFLPYVPERIHRLVPDARLIVILRDPVRRAHSHWWHRFTRGFETRSFAEVVEEELERLDSGDEFQAKFSEEAWRANFLPGTTGLRTADLRQVPIVEMGQYARQVERYSTRFGNEAMKVLFLDDLRRRESEVVRGVLEFIEVDPDQAVGAVEASNRARSRVKTSWAFFLERLAWRTGAHRVVPKPIRSAALRLVGSRPRSRPELEGSIADRLYEHYASHDERLAEILGRSIPWRSR